MHCYRKFSSSKFYMFLFWWTQNRRWEQKRFWKYVCRNSFHHWCYMRTLALKKIHSLNSSVAACILQTCRAQRSRFTVRDFSMKESLSISRLCVRDTKAEIMNREVCSHDRTIELLTRQVKLHISLGQPWHGKHKVLRPTDQTFAFSCGWNWLFCV